MIGVLPVSLEIGGVEYPIETDFRNVLTGLAACGDPDLTGEEKIYVLMKRLFREHLDKIPKDLYKEAAGKTKWFIDCGQEEDEHKPPHKVIDWEQDEAILFPAVNKVAGIEVRSVSYLHWWSFIGCFMEIEEGTFSVVLGIRQKRARGKPLEKWEREFYHNNKKLCDLKTRYTKEEQEEIEYWNSVLG